MLLSPGLYPGATLLPFVTSISEAPITSVTLRQPLKVKLSRILSPTRRPVILPAAGVAASAATTTASFSPLNPSGVFGHGEGCASTLSWRTIEVRPFPFHPIGDVGASRAAQ